MAKNKVTMNTGRDDDPKELARKKKEQVAKQQEKKQSQKTQASGKQRGTVEVVGSKTPQQGSQAKTAYQKLMADQQGKAAWDRAQQQGYNPMFSSKKTYDQVMRAEILRQAQQQARPVTQQQTAASYQQVLAQAAAQAAPSQQSSGSEAYDALAAKVRREQEGSSSGITTPTQRQEQQQRRQQWHDDVMAGKTQLVTERQRRQMLASQMLAGEQRADDRQARQQREIERAARSYGRHQEQQMKDDPAYRKAMLRDYDSIRAEWEEAAKVALTAQEEYYRIRSSVNNSSYNQDTRTAWAAQQQINEAYEAALAAGRKRDQLYQAMQARSRMDQDDQKLQTELEVLRKIGYNPKTGKAKQTPPANVDKWEGYQYLTAEERLVYDYLKQDREDATKVQAYLNTFQEDRQNRRDEAWARANYLPVDTGHPVLDWLNNAGRDVTATFDSLLSGGKQALEQGMDALDRIDDPFYRPPTYEDETSRRLAAAQRQLPDNLYGLLTRSTWGAAGSIGRMLPSMALGNYVGSVLASMPAAVAAMEAGTEGILTAERVARSAQNTAFFLSVKGEAYSKAVHEHGMDPRQAGTYSTLNALSEVGLQNAIGGIAQFGGLNERAVSSWINRINNINLRVAVHSLWGTFGEEVEESLQNLLDPLFVTMLTGKEYQWPTMEEMYETWISTFLMTTAMNAGDTVDYRREQTLQKQIRQNLQTLSKDAKAIGGTEYLLWAKKLDSFLANADRNGGEGYTKERLQHELNIYNAIGSMQEVRARFLEAVQEAMEEDARQNNPAPAEAEAGQTAAVTTQAEAPAAQAEGQVTPQTMQGQQTEATAQQVQLLQQQAAQEAAGLTPEQISREIEEARAELAQTGERWRSELLQARINGLQQGLQAQQTQQTRRPVQTGQTVDNGLGVDGPGLGRVGEAAQIQNQNNMTTAEAVAGTGGSYGAAEGVNDGSQRDAGMGARGEAGAVEGRTGGQFAGDNTQKTDAQKKAAIAALPGRQQSTSEIGVTGGSNNKTLQVITDRTMYTSDMEQAAAKAEAEGAGITFFKGRLEVWNPTAGKYEAMPALVKLGQDGSVNYFVRADGRQRSAGQQFLHEQFHRLLAGSPQLKGQMMDYLRENLSQEQKSALVDAYVEAYNGIYGLEEADVDKYLEEALCDAYAGIRRTRADASAAEQTVSSFREDIDAARRNAQTAAATEQTSGPPVQAQSDNGLDVGHPGMGKVGEQRYSFAGERAENASQQALEDAKRMLEDGADPETVRQETGWFQGYDGKWRFEIDDSGMEYRRQGDMQSMQDPEYREYLELWDKVVARLEGTDADMARLRELDKRFSGVGTIAAYKLRDGSATLPDIIQHDELFEAYPMLRDIHVQFAELRPGVNASFDEKNNLIRISYELQGAPEGTLIHEIQHVIQGIEGFTKGANTNYWENRLRGEQEGSISEADAEVRRLFDAMPDEVKARVREYNRANLAKDYDLATQIEDQLYADGYGDLFSEYMDAVVFRDIEQRRLREHDYAEEGTERYFKTAGEIEARDAADRRTLTAEQRKNIRPDIDQEDVGFVEKNDESFDLANAPERRKYIQYKDQADADSRVKQTVKELLSAGKTVLIDASEITKFEKAVDWNDNKEARKAIQGVLKPFIGQSVYFQEENSYVEAYLTRRGIDHATGGGNSARKGAAFSKFLELVTKAKYSYSTRRESHSAQDARLEGKVFWDKYVAIAQVQTKTQVDGNTVLRTENYPVVFTLRSIDEDVRAQIYDIWAKNEAAVSRGDGTQGNPANALPSYGATATSEPMIPEMTEEVKNKDNTSGGEGGTVQKFSAAEEGEFDDEPLGVMETGPEIFSERFARASRQNRQAGQDNGLDVGHPGMGKVGESRQAAEGNPSSTLRVPSPQGEGNAAFDALIEQENDTDRRIAERKAARERAAELRKQQAVEKKRQAAEKASEQTLKNRIKENEQTLKQFDTMKKGDFWNEMLEARQKAIRESVEIDKEALARKVADRKAGRVSQKQLRESISESRSELKALEAAEKTGELNDAQQQRKTELQQQLDRNNQRLEELRRKQREQKARKKELELQKEQPRQARKEFRQDALNLFSIPAEKRSVISAALNHFADRAFDAGYVAHEDRQALIRTLYEQGVVTQPADEYYGAIRESVRNRRIYVGEDVRAEFGDDWNAFRQNAWGNGIYLTNNKADPGIDTWNQDLAEVFPGSFDAQGTDLKQMLENIVGLAEEGKDQKMSIADMMRLNEKQTGQSIDSQMDELEKKVDQLIDKFAEKAKLEVKLREQGAMRRALERQDNRERAERAAEQKRQDEARKDLMRKIKTLQKMRKTAGPEHRAQIDSMIQGIDTVARSISPTGIENLQQLAKDYEELCQDPNFIRSEAVEARIGRLAKTQINDMDIDTVIELAKAVSGMITTVENSKKLLADEQHRMVSDLAHQAAQEILDSSGSDGGRIAAWTGLEHLDATRLIRRLGGWLKGGAMDSLAQELVDGGTRKLNYMRQATRLFDAFINNEENRNWMQKASGKNAKWIKLSLPTFDFKGHVQETQLEITPMMRVSLYMHSLNNDNMRHIAEGGIRIPDKRWYLKGNMAQAYANGKRVLLTPEQVYAITKEMTPQEKAFAKLLGQYFNKFSTSRINEVSMQMDGFERAGESNYYHIKVDPNFLAKAPESVKQDLSLSSIGSIVNERTHSEMPIVLEDASQALTEHIDQISSYYGYTVPIRDFQAVMQYTFFGKPSEETPSVYNTSMGEILNDKWGAGAQKYLDKLMKDLQQKGSNGDQALARVLSSIRGKLAGASLMINPAVTLSQLASIPGAAAVVGWDSIVNAMGHVADVRSRIDMDLIETYSPVLWYRNQGNSTQELGDYMKDKSMEAKLPWLLGWIQKADTAAIKSLWYAAEHRVSKDTDLAPGSEAEIKAGTDPYYLEVAKVFNKMVYETQPNYTTMQRAQILRSDSDMVKFLTMYKTVPVQYYNVLYEAVGRYHADRVRLKANDTQANQKAAKASKRALVNAVTGIVGANVVYVLIKALIKGATFRGDKYKDEEGKLSWGSTGVQLLKDFVETCAGSIIGGGELLDGAEKLYNAIKTGSYSKYGGIEVNALAGIEDFAVTIYEIASKLHKGDQTGIVGAIKDAAQQFASLCGLPVRNAITYAGAIVKLISPEAAAWVQNVFDEIDKKDLSEEDGRYLRAAIGQLMDSRTDDLSDKTVDELMRLWQAGGNGAIPGGVPFKVRVNNEAGESEEIELGLSDRRIYRQAWNETVSGALEDLMKSGLYQAADDEGKTKLIDLLYQYADDVACSRIRENAATEGWFADGADRLRRGMSVDEMIVARAAGSMSAKELQELDGDYLREVLKVRMDERADVSGQTIKELQRLVQAGQSVLPADVPKDFDTTTDGETMKHELSTEELDRYREVWNAAVSGSLDQLLRSEAYKAADDEGKTKLIKKLYDYAGQTSRAAVEADTSLDTWIQAGQAAVKSGVPLDEYITFHMAVSRLDSKDEDGNSVSGLKNQRGLELLDGYKWTDKQKEQVYIDIALSNASMEKQERLLRTSGLSWKQAAEVLGVVGNNWDHAQTIIKQKTSQAVKIKALESYLSNTEYKAAYAGYVYSVDLKLWMDARNKADTNGNGSITQEEATNYLDQLNVDRDVKAYLWQMLCSSSKAKSNPYSTTWGEEFWEYMQTVEKPDRD